MMNRQMERGGGERKREREWWREKEREVKYFEENQNGKRRESTWGWQMYYFRQGGGRRRSHVIQGRSIQGTCAKASRGYVWVGSKEAVWLKQREGRGLWQVAETWPRHLMTILQEQCGPPGPAEVAPTPQEFLVFFLSSRCLPRKRRLWLRNCGRPMGWYIPHSGVLSIVLVNACNDFLWNSLPGPRQPFDNSSITSQT